MTEAITLLLAAAMAAGAIWFAVEQFIYFRRLRVRVVRAEYALSVWRSWVVGRRLDDLLAAVSLTEEALRRNRAAVIDASGNERRDRGGARRG